MSNSNDLLNMSFSSGDNFISSTITPPSLVTLTTAAGDIPISIFSYTPYLRQRECVKDCIWHSGSTATDLIIALGCSGPWVNECYCKGNGNENGNRNYEHATTASSFLRSCVAESCRTPSADDLVTSGFSVYNEYCAKAGMAIPSIPWVVTSVAAGSGERAGQPTGVFGAGSGSGSGSGSLGLSSGAKVGIAVGSTAAVLALVMSAVITWRLKVKARISLSRRKDDNEVKGLDAGRTVSPQLQVIRHKGLPSVTTRYN
ncbi:unnamed protein product [Sordaria macrospora k-hell]|uniref:WGS project CABT00000000 data, contig 2.4 n=1 Tax=Sordaria macrospora (strain ATCC MYA-333 / DSM 997 / K(L3346) / K-hell) TaxID=771870 RepID=F7VQP0_SORMK|nr:uncharacterized protein SMAC_01388 [Sordaria macrospora k-hell]KAH7634475.1 hypothetical protein B0T09DRAFT_6210 [Sordaria sp. MPI-SDFR-AT-0083]CCC07822.1 unnamed protein product [Sordaria macrospora k-hell]